MKSLHARLTLSLVTGVVLLFTALGGATYLRTRALLTAQFDDGLRARSAALISLLQWQPDGSVALNYQGEFMPEFEGRSGDFYFAVWMAKDGRLLETSPSLHEGILPRFAGSVAVPEFRDFQIANAAVRAIGICAPRSVERDAGAEGAEHSAGGVEEFQPGADFVVAADTAGLHARLHALAFELCAGAALGLAAIVFVIHATLRRGLRPLDELSAHAERLDAARLAEHFPDAGLPAELAPIAARLNDLLSRLRITFARERRFSADVAHELRTPIAELHTLAEVGASLAGDGRTSADIGTFFEDARNIAHRMGSTVSTLLLLARCESGQQPAVLDPVPAGELLAALCEDAEHTARARGVLVENNVPRDWQCESDRELLARLLRLLVENALEYTHAPGLIRTRLSEHGFTITNGPMALTQEDLPHLFERFWRKDAARSSDVHSGLGLSLAVEIARLLNVEIVPKLNATTLTFHIRFRPAKPGPRIEMRS